MSSSIEDRAAIGARAALERSWDTHKLSVQTVTADTDGGVTVATHVDERHMRRQVRIGHRSRPAHVAALDILQTRSHAVTKEHVHRRLWAAIGRRLSDE